MLNKITNSSSNPPHINKLPTQQINELSIYTPEQTQSLLQISRSTFMRMVKKGVLRANKVGGQYRVLGREMLRLLLPTEEYEKLKGFVNRSDK